MGRVGKGNVGQFEVLYLPEYPDILWGSYVKATQFPATSILDSLDSLFPSLPLSLSGTCCRAGCQVGAFPLGLLFHFFPFSAPLHLWVTFHMLVPARSSSRQCVIASGFQGVVLAILFSYWSWVFNWFSSTVSLKTIHHLSDPLCVSLKLECFLFVEEGYFYFSKSWRQYHFQQLRLSCIGSL